VVEPFNEARYKALLEGLEMTEISKSNLEFSGRIDSEYYRKNLLSYEQQITSKKFVRLDKIANFLIGPFGSSFDTDNYVDNGEYRYVRGQDVKPFILKDGDNKYVPPEDYSRLIKYALNERDILISVVGTLGNACIVQKKDLPAIFSCKSTVIRTSGINPVFLLTYLNCKYGRELLIRKERGAIQKGLNLDDLKTILIPEYSKDFQTKIEQTFYKAQDLLIESKNQYQQAEAILLETLGLKEFEPSADPLNVKTFKESFLSTGRLDAEYYQKKYEEVVNHITAKKYDRLVNIAFIKKSIEPGSDVYSDEGLPFLRVSDYNKFGVNEPEKKLNGRFCKENEELIKKLRPKKETILFSKDGSVGAAYMLRKDADFITSGAILHLKVKRKEQVIPEYLTLVLNSKLVQMQAERDAGGSIILHWRVGEIENVAVPIIEYTKQQEIAALVEESFRLKKQSEQLLETAKRAVEIAIEENEENAMKKLIAGENIVSP
jgi:restriction endonuclease S subunit